MTPLRHRPGWKTGLVLIEGCALRQLRWTEALHLLQEMDGTKVSDGVREEFRF